MAKFMAGAYLMTHPITVGAAKSATKGSPYVYVAGTISKVAHDGAWLDVESPEERQVDCYVTGGAIEITARQLGKLGFNGNFASPALDPGMIANGIIVYCNHEAQDNGKVYEKWSFEQGFKRENKPVNADEIRRLNEQYRAATAKAAVPKAAPAIPSAALSVPTTTPPASGDEIPF